MTCLIAHIREIEVEIECHVAQIASDVEDTNHLHLIVAAIAGVGGEVIKRNCIQRVPADEMDASIERVSIEHHAGTILYVEVAIDEVLQIETVFTTLNVVRTIEGERTLVVIVCL